MSHTHIALHVTGHWAQLYFNMLDPLNKYECIDASAAGYKLNMDSLKMRTSWLTGSNVPMMFDSFFMIKYPFKYFLTCCYLIRSDAMLWKAISK